MKSFSKRKASKVTLKNHHKHQEALKDVNKETKAEMRPESTRRRGQV